MYVKYKEILPVLFWIGITSLSRVSCSGWKPIPPPRGLYVSKAPHPIRGGPEHEHAFKHPLLDDFRIEALKSSLLEQESDVLQEEDFPKHHNHKYNFDEIFSKPIDEPFFKKEPLKTFKPSIQAYDNIPKQPPPISFNSYNVFRTKKPGKTVFFEQPEEVKPIYKEEIKYIKQYKPTLYDEGKYHKIPSYSENEIKPFYPHKGHDEHCTLYKVAFRQDLYFQYIQYKIHMPDLKEFTLCMWNKFHNHSNDHPLFSYAVRHQPKAILMWVSNTERSNYYNMKVNDHTIFRLNYPIRLNKWYHTCQSWNGKTGEWQVWVNAERIGRGFHNLLVGHVIPGGGLAISGQEQRQLGGGFLEGPGAPKGSGGFLGEITMVQFYKVALTAGKAYTDHRHHHSLYASTTPEPPELPSEDPPPAPEHPFLENGQLKRPLKVFELAEALRTKGNLDTPENQPQLPADFFNNHFGHNYYGSIDSSMISHYNNHENALNLIPISDHNIYKRNDGNEKKGNKRQNNNNNNNNNKTPTNYGSNHKMEEETERPEKVKFVMNPPAQVHVEKIKFPRNQERSDRVTEFIGEYPEWKNEEKARGKRQINMTDIVMDEQFMGSFITVDEGKTEPDAAEEGRNGRAMVIRKRPTRQNHQLSHIRRLPTSNRPKRISLPHEAPPAHRFRPHVRKEDKPQKLTRKESDSSEEDGEKEKETSKRQILLGDGSLGFPSLSLIGGEYGPLYGPVPVLGIPLQVPQSPPDFPTQEQQDDNPLNEPEEENTGPAQPEPAEGEVRRIMGVCSGCELDPFRKVAVISWRSTPKKIYSGALFLKARPECRRF